MAPASSSLLQSNTAPPPRGANINGLSNAFASMRVRSTPVNPSVSRGHQNDHSQARHPRVQTSNYNLGDNTRTYIQGMARATSTRNHTTHAAPSNMVSNRHSRRTTYNNTPQAGSHYNAPGSSNTPDYNGGICRVATAPVYSTMQPIVPAAPRAVTFDLPTTTTHNIQRRNSQSGSSTSNEGNTRLDASSTKRKPSLGERIVLSITAHQRRPKNHQPDSESDDSHETAKRKRRARRERTRQMLVKQGWRKE